MTIFYQGNCDPLRLIRSHMTLTPDFALRVVAIDDDLQYLKFISTILSGDQVVVSTTSRVR